MVKRITCRVVRSKPLGKSSPLPLLSCESKKRSGCTLNKVHHKIGDVATGIPQGKYAGNSVTYTRLLDITSVSIDSDLTGQILDCYV